MDGVNKPLEFRHPKGLLRSKGNKIEVERKGNLSRVTGWWRRWVSVSIARVATVELQLVRLQMTGGTGLFYH